MKKKIANKEAINLKCILYNFYTSINIVICAHEIKISLVYIIFLLADVVFKKIPEIDSNVFFIFYTQYTVLLKLDQPVNQNTLENQDGYLF